MRVLPVLLLVVASAAADNPDPDVLPAIDEKTKGMEKRPGFFALYRDSNRGKLWLEIADWDAEFLYVHSLPHGVGSNDLGLDRGQIGKPRIVFFERVGRKVLLVQPNYSYRALTDNQDEKRAVEQSFAQSVLHGFAVVAETDKRVLVDATSFFLSDAHGVAETLVKAKEGKYKLDPERSALYFERSNSFPNNTDAEAILTFVGEPTGKHLPTVTPTPKSVTVHQHHSFIRLPQKGYRPREFHPQSGYFWTGFKDYSTPLGQPMDKRFILRHRLEKTNSGEVVKPIVYYLDRGVPEPVRSALLDGAKWWATAFEKAGFPNAFKVEMLPADKDPMDVTVNIIQWVHRSTRGWSYGNTIYDPRTGEIIKGHVSLGSLRVRQDMLIAEGLLAPFSDGKTVSPKARDMALARLRQLSAHEVGHTLGLAHNFAASTKGNGSVMDYPHPYLTINAKNEIDVSKAYGVGVGAWDIHAIRYGYSILPEKEEATRLKALREDARKKGLVFISDQDARPVGGAHPKAHLWDNGADPIRELERLMRIRKRALARFGESVIPPDTPMALLEERLVPVYLLHRYQVEAVAKLLGGLDYEYTSRGEKTEPQIVSGAHQTRALDALLATVSPEALALPKNAVRLIPPRPQGYSSNRELFPRKTGPTFDPLAAAESAADHVVSLILEPQRCARLAAHHIRDPRTPSLVSVMDRLTHGRWEASTTKPDHDALTRTVDNAILYRLMVLAANDKAHDQVRALALETLDRIRTRIENTVIPAKDRQAAAHRHLALTRLRQFRAHPERLPLPKPAELPPGSPIGSCRCGCWRRGLLDR